MKVFTSFYELRQAHRNGEVPLCILNEAAQVQLSCLEDDIEMSPQLAFAKSVKNQQENGSPMALEMNLFIVDELCKVAETLDETKDVYSGQLGGDLHICENENDLLSIEGMDFEWAEGHDGKWPNVTDMDMSWDVCDYVQPGIESGYAVVLSCTNNAGGPIYYIPEHLWEKARIAGHIEATNKFWGNAND